MVSQTIPPADRIRELSAINSEVAEMLQSAGQAINSLTNRPLNKATDEDEDFAVTEENKEPTLDERKAVFTAQTQAYYTGLQSVIARLRRQAYALEEAGIISAEAPTLASTTHQRQSAPAAGAGRGQAPTTAGREAERLTNGGLGNLDVGWLNSRGNKVGVEKENELVEEGKKLLEDILSRETGAE